MRGRQLVGTIGAHDGLAGVQRTSADTFLPAQRIQVVATISLLVAAAGGVDLHTDMVTGACCLLILLLGLPHGAIDITTLLEVGRSGRQQLQAIGLYLMAGSAMALVWWLAPDFALALFMVIAIVHFSEDWREIQSPFLAHGTALGFLVAPGVLHRAEIGLLFKTLAGADGSGLLGSVMTLVTPIALTCIVVTLSMLLANGRRETAVTGLVALFGLLLLPPVLGFTLFFCLLHSPRHFAAALGTDADAAWQTWKTPIVLTTTAALGLALILFWLVRSPSISDGLIRTSFMTLSMLTVPHMLLPKILGKR
jgi:Brp/Blh family beta-carotene 15,15'-monooxygenase